MNLVKNFEEPILVIEGGRGNSIIVGILEYHHGLLAVMGQMTVMLKQGANL